LDRMDNEQTNQSTESAPGERSRFGSSAAGDRPSRPYRDRRDSAGRGGRGGGGTGRRKQAVFADNEVVDYKDIQRLKSCLDERGKILPRRKTHCSAGKQRELTVAIKRARHLALLQYIPSDRRR
jgi:small subunit ribosomal protein S18